MTTIIHFLAVNVIMYWALSLETLFTILHESVSHWSSFAQGKAEVLTAFGCLQHETRLSVLNFTLKKLPGCEETISNKQKLLFVTGFRCTLILLVIIAFLNSWCSIDLSRAICYDSAVALQQRQADWSIDSFDEFRCTWSCSEINLAPSSFGLNIILVDNYYVPSWSLVVQMKLTLVQSASLVSLDSSLGGFHDFFGRSALLWCKKL